jgi:hypothetical protein
MEPLALPVLVVCWLLLVTPAARCTEQMAPAETQQTHSVEVCDAVFKDQLTATCSAH